MIQAQREKKHENDCELLVKSVNVGSYTLSMKALPYIGKDHLICAQGKQAFCLKKLILHQECVRPQCQILR